MFSNFRKQSRLMLGNLQYELTVHEIINARHLDLIVETTDFPDFPEN